METNKPKQKPPTSIRLSDEVYSKLVEKAKKDCRSVTKEIEFILRKYFEMLGE